MIPPDMAESTNASHACFLCTLDTQPCAVKQLEGQVIYAHEFTTQGEITPYITLDLGATYASLQLTHTYRGLVKGLQELGKNLRTSKLTMRVYHPPPLKGTTEHNRYNVERDCANDNTLAILEPHTILNIHDLHHADYCPKH